MTELERLLEVVAKMTPGPWSSHTPSLGGPMVLAGGGPLIERFDGRCSDEDDAIGIAATRNAIEALIDEVQAGRIAEAGECSCDGLERHACTYCDCLNVREWRRLREATDAAIREALSDD